MQIISVLLSMNLLRAGNACADFNGEGMTLDLYLCKDFTVSHRGRRAVGCSRRYQ